LAARRADAESGQGLLDGAAVLPQVAGDQRLDGRPAVGVEGAAAGEMFGQRTSRIAAPVPGRGGEVVLVDQLGLQGEQSKEPVAVGARAGHGSILAVFDGGSGPLTGAAPRAPGGDSKLL